MERVKDLNRYQKWVLILMTVMILIFGVIYYITTSRVGYAYHNTILVPGEEKGNTVYSGEINWEQVKFTVYADKTVEFQHGETKYGPYSVKEDFSAIPEDEDFAGNMVGIELREGDEILFRGGVLELDEMRLLYDEAGSPDVVYVITNVNGVAVDEFGNEIDPLEPTANDILDLLDTPTLTHKGEWVVWFICLVTCLVNAISILFADELFRFSMAFHVYDADKVEPSDWELAGRYISWTAVPILVFGFLIWGLTI